MESQNRSEHGSTPLQDLSLDRLKPVGRIVSVNVELVEEEGCPAVATDGRSPSHRGEHGPCQHNLESELQSKSDSVSVASQGATVDQREVMDQWVVRVKEEPVDEEGWPDIAVDVRTISPPHGGDPRICQGVIETECGSQERQIDLEGREQRSVLTTEGSRYGIANVSVEREFSENDDNMESEQSARQEENTGWMPVEMEMEGDSQEEDTGWIAEDRTSGYRESLSFEEDQCPSPQSQHDIQNVQRDHSNVRIKEEKEDLIEDKTGQQKEESNYLQSDDDDDIHPFIKLDQTDVGVRTIVGKKLDPGRIISDGRQEAIIDADEHHRKQNEMDCEATGDHVTHHLDQSHLEEHVDIQSEGILASGASSHESDRTYACKLCSKAYTQREHLYVHMRTTHTGERPFPCHVCPKAFVKRSGLNQHLRSHAPERPYACNLCSKTFIQQSLLDKHMRTHTGERPYACEFCSKAFSQSGHLNIHMRSHSGERPYACHVCSKACISKGHLNIHMRTHTGEKPYACEFCSKAFSQSGHLNIHMRSHTGERPYACHVCPKAFRSRRDINDHMRTHTGERPYACEFCSKAFSSRCNLKTHKRRHTGERPYACHVCSKACSSSGDLNIHMRTHTGERPHVCELCSKAFSQSGQLNKHMKTHTGERPYPCHVCSEVFTQEDDLNNHLKSHSVDTPHA